jgi:hypothetical protein
MGSYCITQGSRISISCNTPDPWVPFLGMGNQNFSYSNHLESSLWGLPPSSTCPWISNDCYRALIRPLVCKLWPPEVLWASLVEGHMAPMWLHLISTILRFLPPAGKVYPPSNPMAGLNPHLTHRLEENLTFDASVLNAPFSYCTHVLRSPEFLDFRRPGISPRGSGLRAFQLTHDAASQTPGVRIPDFPKSRNLSMWWCARCRGKYGGSQILLLPIGPNRWVPEVTRDKEEMTRGPYSGWHVSCVNGHIGSVKCMNPGDKWHIKHGSTSPWMMSHAMSPQTDSLPSPSISRSRCVHVTPGSTASVTS